jgi:large subunit ribosomal protein L1
MEAMKLAKETSFTKFDATIEVHIRLGVDTRHADQQVRDTVMLPHGLGRTVRVLVFAEGDAAREAQKEGADYIVDDEIIKQIQNGWFEFDATVSTPKMMSTVGRLGKILGPRGLMPNPKAGTVVPEDDLPRVIKELKAGRVEFRTDKTANLHVPIGKASFETQKLFENFSALIDSVRRSKPAASKGAFFRTITVTSTMGPGIRIEPSAAIAVVE